MVRVEGLTDPTGVLLSWLLGTAVLLPLASFVLILLFGPLMGKAGRQAGYCATGAILSSCILSFIALGVWLSNHAPAEPAHAAHDAHVVAADDHATADDAHAGARVAESAESTQADANHADAARHGEQLAESPSYFREVYVLGKFAQSQVSISVYIDALTVCMFAMVTLIATSIHFYATGYMSDELVDDYVDHEVTTANGDHLHRPGRYPRFFQSMSLFCFSMLGLVLAGNALMTFVFWELVGICSYFLIGFYVERRSASTAANKAFIVNRVGDFGMIIGLMALWGSLGTLSYGGPNSLFAQVRPGPSHELIVPDGMVRAAARDQVAGIIRSAGPEASREEQAAAVANQVPTWRAAMDAGEPGRAARWLLIVAGLGIFCGCVGKSAQFPLHVWLPDAMEGPTPVSALVHSATMVAAGVFLVARFYPVFAPEVLLIIALTGTITLFLAATIAITATDIKRVLAYSTVSQLGYMMLALGVGGWLAGVLHLFTHAFFKSMLFMCSGSVIHAVHTNEMPEMGGLRRKMPWTAYTMLIGCLAIAGAGLPFTFSAAGEEIALGLSGYYSKDAILEQALSFRHANPLWGTFFFVTAAGGAAITAFYMFRLWYLTFAGAPRNAHRYEHAHESPPVMYLPLVLLSVLAIGVAWGPVQAMAGALVALAIFLSIKLRAAQPRGTADTLAHGRAQGHVADHHDEAQHDDSHHSDSHHSDSHHGDSHAAGWRPINAALGLALLVLMLGIIGLALPRVTLSSLLEQARPAGTLSAQSAALGSLVVPNEHDSHAPAIRVPATWIAFSTALTGFILATAFYGLRILDAAESRRAFAPVHRLLLNKWWFDELYQMLFVNPAHMVARWILSIDRWVIDGFVDGSAGCVRIFSIYWDRIADRGIVDGVANGLAALTYRTGLSLRRWQTGNLRQYVMFIVVGTVVIFAIASFWRHAMVF
jgi:NADH:ubiquinone oxidoreductase subunit 5 (subunit L)/multisubunit Na+/H+ antiporter MnhA subunit